METQKAAPEAQYTRLLRAARGRRLHGLARLGPLSVRLSLDRNTQSKDLGNTRKL